MKMTQVNGWTLPEVYHKALLELQKKGEIVPCPDYNTTMKELALTMYIVRADSEPFISRLFPGGYHELKQYTMEICDGILDFMVGKAPNVWEYTYHQRFAYQLPFIIEELNRNPYSRRAIMNIRDFEVDSKNDHPACLQSIHFNIRDDELNMTVMMRSNDAVKATFMNAVGFIFLQKQVAKELNKYVGSYTHIAYSFHAYERDFDTLKHYADRIMTDSYENLVYCYKGCWDKLMEGETESIMQMVQEQKNKYL